MIGGKDSFQVNNFTSEEFIEKYSAFINETQSMPSAPYMVLVTPSYSAASVIAQRDKPFMFSPI